MKTKNIFFSFLTIGLIYATSCNKKGCIDENATNYSIDAKKNDGTCVYPTKVVIKSISAINYPTTNTSNDTWDSPGEADCYITVLDNNEAAIYQSQSYINPTTTVTWQLQPTLTIEEVENFGEIIIKMHDEDGAVDDFMGEVTINLADYTQNGSNSIKYPDDIEFDNSIFRYNIVVDWK